MAKTKNQEVLHSIGTDLDTKQKIALLDSMIGFGDGADDDYLMGMESTEALETIFSIALRDFLYILCIDNDGERRTTHNHCAEDYANELEQEIKQPRSSNDQQIIEFVRQLNVWVLIVGRHFSADDLVGTARDLLVEHPLAVVGACSKCGTSLSS